MLKILTDMQKVARYVKWCTPHTQKYNWIWTPRHICAASVLYTNMKCVIILPNT